MDKAINNQTNYSDREYLISRGRNASPSREFNRVLFGNQGKRQVSHLPFIKLNDNIKVYLRLFSYVKVPEAIKDLTLKGMHLRAINREQKVTSEVSLKYKRRKQIDSILWREVPDRPPKLSRIKSSSDKKFSHPQRSSQSACKNILKNYVRTETKTMWLNSTVQVTSTD